MTIVADTSGLLALFNEAEPQHEATSRAVEQAADTLAVSPYVLAELDYLVLTRVGVRAELDVLAELTSGAYDLPALDRNDLAQATQLIERYRDQGIGVADASLVVLADRYRTRTLLTLDRRHFDVVRPIGGGRFRIVP